MYAATTAFAGDVDKDKLVAITKTAGPIALQN